MNFFASLAFLCAVTMTGVLGTRLSIGSGNHTVKTPLCCTTGSGCRIECNRVSSAVNLISQLIEGCYPQEAMFAIPGLNVYVIAGIRIRVIPGLTARMYLYDVIVYIFYIRSNYYYISTVGNVNEAGCPTIRLLTFSSQLIFPGCFTSHLQARDVIARLLSSYDAGCNSIQPARPRDDDPENAFATFELGPTTSFAVAQPASINNAKQSAVKTTNYKLGLGSMNRIYGSINDGRNYIEYVQEYASECGLPPSCKILRYLDSIESIITRAGCNLNCICPSNQNGARLLSKCAAVGFTTVYPPYVTISAGLAFLFPPGCSDINFIYTYTTFNTDVLRIIFNNLLLLF